MLVDWIGVTIPAIATITYVGLLGLVLASQNKTRAIRAFALFLLAFVVWTSGSFAWHLTASLTWNHVLVSGGILGMLCFAYFVHVFLSVESRLVVCVLLSWATVCLASTWGGWIVTDSYMVNGVAHMRLGPAFALNMVLFVLSYSWSMVQLLRHYARTHDPLPRYRIQYVMLALGVWCISVSTNAIPGIGNYPIDVALGIVTAGVLAYAILRHQLLDITVVIRRGLAYSVLTASIAAVYLLSVFILQAVLRQILGANAYASAFVMAVVFALLYDPMRQRTQFWIDRVFFRERVDMQQMLAEVSQTTASILDVDSFGPLVLDRILSSMALTRAALFVANKDTDSLEPVVQRGFETSIDFTLSADNPLLATLAASSGGISCEALLHAPASIGLLSRERRDLEALAIEWFVPVKLKGELVGILGLGPKRSEAPYTGEDTVALKTMANQIAVAIGNARLVSELQHSLNDLKQTQSQLIQAAKLSAVGQLVAGVAHELNNPLTTIKGYAELVATQEVPADVRRDLERINEAADRCTRIVRNLLTFARRHSSELSRFDLNDLLEATLSLQDYRFRVDNIVVHRDLDASLPHILADQYQLQQVFFNIITNAQQAMRTTHGGALTVLTRRDGDRVRVIIGDTGPGMTPEVQARIFEPFFTTKEVGDGTGLGLSICYGIVQEHDGHIHVQSKPGEGATFTIELPMRETLGQPSSRSAPAVPAAEAGSRVLIVDDEEAIRELVCRALVEDKLRVDVAATGLDALEFLDQASGGGYQLIVSDVKMPDLDGPQLYSFLSYNRPGLEKRVVFMTGDTSSAETRAFLESTHLPFITKPFELAALRDLVRTTLNNLGR